MRVRLPWRIVRLRQQHALARAALSKKSGLARSTLSQLERGVFSGIRFETLLALAAVFEVSIDYVAGLDSADDLVRAAAFVGRPCPQCGLAGGHSVPDCVLQMFEKGRSHAFIAAVHQMTVSTVEFMLREEIRIRLDR